MIERINVQAFIFTVKPEFKVLILKRTPERSGYWQPACGGVEDGEKLEEAVKREIFEETGIMKLKSIINLNYTFTYEETKKGKLMNMQDFCFAAQVDNIPCIKISEEHEEYKWCSYDEAKKYLKWEHNIIALGKLMDYI